MSLSTSYRFEAMTEKRGLQKAVQRQQERIKRDDMMASREQQAKMEVMINLKSEWNEALEAVAAGQKMRNDRNQMHAELRLASKAAITVRQAALRKLLEDEYQQYEKELHDIGKAFYIKRE